MSPHQGKNIHGQCGCGYVDMPKLLISRFQFKDLIQNAKRSRRIDILLRPRKRKRDVQCVLVRDTQAQAGPSKLSSRDANMLHSSLEEVLRDQKHLATFRAFLRSEFSEENLDFWLACEAFGQIASPGERHRQAEHIYQEFLHPNARREVNVDQCTRERIQSCLALQQQQQQKQQQQKQQQQQQQKQQQQQHLQQQQQKQQAAAAAASPGPVL
ncbi:hypothetical protein CRUP_007677 [Coryphaenoides rupestris]|nr:hypothetical protein CRUP_007677 [Coryphaenoides rupestris]